LTPGGRVECNDKHELQGSKSERRKAFGREREVERRARLQSLLRQREQRRVHALPSPRHLSGLRRQRREVPRLQNPNRIQLPSLQVLNLE
jgi:hypothetical protein